MHLIMELKEKKKLFPSTSTFVFVFIKSHYHLFYFWNDLFVIIVYICKTLKVAITLHTLFVASADAKNVPRCNENSVQLFGWFFTICIAVIALINTL